MKILIYLTNLYFYMKFIKNLAILEHYNKVLLILILLNQIFFLVLFLLFYYYTLFLLKIHYQAL